MPIAVLVVIPDPLLRTSIVGCLASMPDMIVRAALPTTAQARAWCGYPPIDVLLVDAETSDLHEGGGIPALRLQFRAAQFVLLGDQPSPATLIAAMRAGVDGYLPRSTSLDGLIQALRGLGRGEAALSRIHMGLLVRALHAESTDPPDRTSLAAALQHLSPREVEVLSCIRQGYTNEEIAQVLVVSLHTVKTHVSNILTKTGVRSRHQLAANRVDAVR